MRAHCWIAEAGLMAALLLGAASPAGAQSRGPVAVEAVTGHAGYIDDVWDNRALIGALVKWHVTPRLAVGPEVLYQHGSSDDHELLVTGTATYDLVSDSDRRRVVPFIVAGAGLARRSSLVGQGPGTVGLVPYVTHEATASGGIGVRLAVAPSCYLSGDVRLGWEPERRVTVAFGWRP